MFWFWSCSFDFWNDFFISKICPFDFSNNFFNFQNLLVWFLKWFFDFKNLSVWKNHRNQTDKFWKSKHHLRIKRANFRNQKIIWDTLQATFSYGTIRIKAKRNKRGSARRVHLRNQTDKFWKSKDYFRNL